MANRLFEHFPEDSKCPICGKSDDRPCFLLAIDGTGGDIVQGKPTHADCITEHLAEFQYDKNYGIIYMRAMKLE
jgi:hypothetical protein